jgi:hypothetical protein
LRVNDNRLRDCTTLPTEKLLDDLATFSPLPITCIGGGALRIVVGPAALPADHWSRNMNLAVLQDLRVDKIYNLVSALDNLTRSQEVNLLIIVEDQAPDLDTLP